MSVPLGTFFLLSAALASLFSVSIILYRLLFHPLARFPGPKIAAATYWYEFYFDIIKKPGGQYMYRLQDLHRKYGPIIRINPDEIQVQDPSWFDQLYVSAAAKAKRNRYPRANAANGSPASIASTIPHDLHRLRKTALHPYFSKAAITRLEPRLQNQLRLMCKQMAKFAKPGEVLDVGTAYTALTLDIITDYCFGRSWQCLTAPSFHPAWKRIMTDAFTTSQTRKQLPLFTKLFTSVPQSVAQSMNPDLALFFESQKLIHQQVEETVSGKKEKATASGEAATIFHEILNSSLPPKEKSVDRLADDGLVLVFAGAETTARTLTSMTYHLLTNPDILSKLRDELSPVMSNGSEPVSLKELEAVDYLTAVVKEALRMAAPFTNRSLLYSPDEPIHYKDWTIPAGTPVCMNINRILHNSSIFPDPEVFSPQRWLVDVEERRRLEKFFVPFSRGTRSCLGMNLGYAELYLVTAHVFYNFDMELVDDTDRARDVDVVRDCFVGLPTPESKGIRVRLTERKV